MRIAIRWRWLAGVFLTSAALARAETAGTPEERFERGRYELSLTSGVLFSPMVDVHNRPVLNFTVTELQFGCMLADVKGTGHWWRGNLEAVAAVFGDAMIVGSGNYMAGTTGWLRYNFVPQG